MHNNYVSIQTEQSAYTTVAYCLLIVVKIVLTSILLPKITIPC